MALYHNPQFVNDQAPALNATNMNNLANSAEHAQSYELSFTLSSHSYAEASAEDKQNYTNYWDNQNIVVTGTQVTSGDLTVDGPKFKDKVSNVEGSYAFTYNSSTTKWQYSGTDIADSTRTTIPSYGITGIHDPAEGAAYQNITVVLTFDSYKEQKVTVAGITSTLSGSVGVAVTATKAQYDTAAYGQLRCIGQGNGYLIIVSYGVTPTVDIPCVVTVDSDGQVIYG